MTVETATGPRASWRGAVVRSEDTWILVSGAVLSVALIALGVLGSILEEYPGTTFFGPIEGIIVGVVGLVIGAVYLGKRTHIVKGSLRVDELGLFCDDRLLGKRRELVRAALRRQTDHALVRIEQTQGRPIVVTLPSHHDAEELLRALAESATIWGVELRALSPVRAWSSTKRASLAAAIVTLPVALGAWLNVRGHSDLGPWVLSFGGLVDIVLFVFLFQSTTFVRLGADGAITRWLGRERYHSFSKVVSIDTSRAVGAHIVEMRMADGPPVPFALSTEDDAQVFADALETARTRVADLKIPHVLSSVRRSTASLKQWVTSLRAAGAGANADHRNAPVPREDLLRVVEDPSSPAFDRVAAAAALAHGGTASELARARATASSVASTKLRIALDWATDPETSDEEVSDILAEIEADADLALSR